MKDKINKLPKWAQDYIADLERQREEAVRTLNKFIDGQTPSDIHYDELICTGESQGPSCKRRYVQTDSLTVEHDGVHLDVRFSKYDPGVRLQWYLTNEYVSDVALIPESYQQVRLVRKQKMRG